MEFALLLPVVAILLATVLQVAVVSRDQMRVVQATSAAARAVIVEPNEAAAMQAIQTGGHRFDGLELAISGSGESSSLMNVRVQVKPTRVPLVGLALSRLRLSEQLTVRVE